MVYCTGSDVAAISTPNVRPTPGPQQHFLVFYSAALTVFCFTWGFRSEMFRNTSLVHLFWIHIWVGTDHLLGFGFSVNHVFIYEGPSASVYGEIHSIGGGQSASGLWTSGYKCSLFFLFIFLYLPVTLRICFCGIAWWTIAWWRTGEDLSQCDASA